MIKRNKMVDKAIKKPLDVEKSTKTENQTKLILIILYFFFICFISKW